MSMTTVTNQCGVCHREFNNTDVIKTTRNRCRDCTNRRLRQYRKEYRAKTGHGVGKVTTPIDRLQVRAFREYAECFVRNMGMSHEEAFMRALIATDDEHMEIALEKHPTEVAKWINGDYVSYRSIQTDFSEPVYVKREHKMRVGNHY